MRAFGYLKFLPIGAIKFDIQIPEGVEEEKSNKAWKDLYPHANEKIQKDSPTPKGRGLKIILRVDSDHVHDLETKRSVTGILQSFSANGSELIVARIALEIIIEYRYKLRMLGVSIIGMSLLYGDNMAVIISTSIPGSNVKKKDHVCAYHFIEEASAADIVNFIYKQSKLNRAVVQTKALPPHLLYNLMKTLILNKN